MIWRKKKESDVSQKELFVVTRTRHPESSYKESNEDTSSKIAKMDEIEKQESVVDSESTVDAFTSVMGPEHLGRLRLHRRGVTRRSLKRIADNSEPVSNATNDAVQQMQERIQKMEEQRTIQQDVTANIIAQLQHARLISTEILAALCVPSPREPVSVPQTDHLICRPSTSNNNQGSEGEQRDENNEGTP